MSANQASDAPLAEAKDKFSSCTLDDRGWREQSRRYARLASSVLHVRREERAIVVDLAEAFDRSALAELIRVETQCCPFFAFALDDASRRLRVTVEDLAQGPALDAIAYALGAGEGD